MSGIIDCEMHIGDEVFVHGYIDEIRKDTIIIRNVGGYFGTSRDEVFYYEEDGSMTEAEQTEPKETFTATTSPCIVKAEQTENSSEKPNNCEPKICDTCRYYNSNIPCGSTPSACKEADKFAEEFVDGLKKLKQTVPTISKMEQVDKDINARSKWETPPKFEHKGFTTTCVSVPACLLEIEDEPQTNHLVKTPSKSRDGHEIADAPLTDAEITELVKEIVHKMIDNSVIAEDTYPDLRQRMHEAVERLGEYYSSENERSE